MTAAVEAEPGVGRTPGRPRPSSTFLAELDAVSRRLEGAGPEEIIGWAVDRFGDGVLLASSFQDCVLVDLASRVAPSIEVVFIDTGFHFPETLAFLEEVRDLYDLRLTVLGPEEGVDEWPCGTARCCELRKVRPLQQLLAGRRAWITGLKRVDTAERAEAPIVSWDPGRGVAKVNPIARWTEEDVAEYTAANKLPTHPLVEKGYLSIGCAPVTMPVGDGAHPREGRWAGTEKTECGLHLSPVDP
jgi:phosphoadenosine phosphosulfate reductase